MRRRVAALGALAAAAGLGAGSLGAGTQDAGAGRPARIVVTDEGHGHLPAWAGAEAPPLGSAPAATRPVPAETSAASVPAEPPLPPATTATTPTPLPAPVALGVQESESPRYTTQLSRSTVPAGEVTVELQNTGEDAHNLRIIRADGTGPATQFPDTDPGATATRTVRFAPGTYRVFCTLTAPTPHDAAGMHATLTVTG